MMLVVAIAAVTLAMLRGAIRILDSLPMQNYNVLALADLVVYQ